MKCIECDARWYGMGSTNCCDCGSDNIDVDVQPSAPDSRVLELVALVNAAGKISDADERLEPYMDDRGNGTDTYCLAIEFGLVKDGFDDALECGTLEAIILQPGESIPARWL